jgi:PPM family protein phosphatase
MKHANAPMNYKFFALTHPGKVRENNEDAVAFDEAHQIAILADGMGGYNAGEIASSMAITVIRTEMTRWLEQAGLDASLLDIRHALQLSVEKANAAILGASQSNPQYAGMGTTLVVGIFCHDRLILGHIGDSRCYRVRDGVLQQITRDHSWLQEQVDAGLITPQQAAVSPNRNLVTRALGVESEVLLEINEFQVAGNDLFMMCSDGLTDMVPDDPLSHMMLANAPLADKAATLIDAANASGGRDNTSVLLALAIAPEKKRSLMSRLLGAARGNINTTND